MNDRMKTEKEDKCWNTNKMGTRDRQTNWGQEIDRQTGDKRQTDRLGTRDRQID